MKNLRIKTQKEILLIEKACQFSDKIFDIIIKQIKLDLTEKELSLFIQSLIRKNGARISFRPIVAFGKNSFEPHHKANGTKLKKNQTILIDYGVKIEGYCSDMTRTLFMGKATKKQKRVYKTVLEAHQKAIDFLKLSIKDNGYINGKEVDKVARNYILSKGYPNIPHSLGHGIGKKVHELPRLSPKKNYLISQGNVFSVEPGIYIKDWGGVRIEDLVVLEEKGLRLLNHSSRDIIEL